MCAKWFSNAPSSHMSQSQSILSSDCVGKASFVSTCSNCFCLTSLYHRRLILRSSIPKSFETWPRRPTVAWSVENAESSLSTTCFLVLASPVPGDLRLQPIAKHALPEERQHNCCLHAKWLHYCSLSQNTTSKD